MTFHNKHAGLIEEVVEAICCIENPSPEWLPHMVYIEEEGECGYPVYNRYKLVDIDPLLQKAMLEDSCGVAEERNLNEINLEWLITIYNWHFELKGEKPPVIPQKETFAYIYPLERFDRRASDEEIVNDYTNDEGQDPCVEKLTPDELTERINDESINFNRYYVRFINI